MSIISLNAISDILVCPKCDSRVTDINRCLACNSQFDTVNGDVPVLVDYEKSILDRQSLIGSGAGSLIERPSSTVRRVAKRLLQGRNPVTIRHVEHFLRLVKSLRSRPRVLVVGGATVGSGLEALYADSDIDLIAFDVYASSLGQFVADAHRIPLCVDSIDGVIVQAILEHVLDPALVVAEIRRVLQPSGVVYAETPFMQQVHEGPYDFTRFTESGHRYLFRHFREVSSGVVGGPGTQLTWSIDHLFRGLFRSRGAGKAAKAAFFWLRLFDNLIPEKFAIDAASGVYFLGTLDGDAPLNGKDAIRRYKGAQQV
jgi:SAM-dependent methyltransferase